MRLNWPLNHFLLLCTHSASLCRSFSLAQPHTTYTHLLYLCCFIDARDVTVASNSLSLCSLIFWDTTNYIQLHVKILNSSNRTETQRAVSVFLAIKTINHLFLLHWCKLEACCRNSKLQELQVQLILSWMFGLSWDLHKIVIDGA